MPLCALCVSETTAQNETAKQKMKIKNNGETAKQYERREYRGEKERERDGDSKRTNKRGGAQILGRAKARLKSARLKLNRRQLWIHNLLSCESTYRENCR